MPDWKEFFPQFRSIVDLVLRFIKARRREEATIAFAALLLWFGYKFSSWLPTELVEFLKPWRGVLIGQGILYLTGLTLLVYGFWRIKRLVWVDELPPVKDRPSAIKGPMAFTEADGELFRKLGRESELQKLLGLVLDDQVLMVVVRGASGAGKTSLLRAGLKHILGDRVTFHYWEAVPTEPEKGLLRAIQEKWPEGAAKPASLDELVNPADALGRQSHVIVLDQFEQLRGSRKIFGLLRRIVRESKPPHRITWVIAFREEFFSDWMKSIASEYERGFHPPLMFLGLFTDERAREVIGQLVNESNLKDSIEQSVINNLVEAATVESVVSPVDIGIGLLVLAELHERQSGKTITIRDYQFAGGAEGLLTQYISRCLELFPKENQEAILKAMLALRDAETNQRLAEGLTIDELAAESGAEARLLKTQLDRLSHRDTRLLETVTSADGSPMRYRLPHERLIPALYRLTGKLLAEVDQAKLKFQNAFQAWKTNDKRSHYLLKAKELRLVERFETQIPWGNDVQEKKSFLYRSKWRRKIIKGVGVIFIVWLIGINWEPLTRDLRWKVKRYLDERAYSATLATLQPQLKNLKKLELTEPFDLERFICLPSQSIEELSLQTTSSSDSLDGLTSFSKCRLLKKLTLNLRSSRVGDLEPLAKLTNLRQLTLDPSFEQEVELEPLLRLSNLTQLTLNLSSSQEVNLEPLSRLNKLTQLTLNLGDVSESYLERLSKLSNLTHLTLDLRGGRGSNLEPLSRLSNLTQLTLGPSYSKENDLESLAKLSNLTQLTLNLSYRKEVDLEPLSRLSNLTQLTLDLGTSQVSNLEALSRLSNLTQLTLSLEYVSVSNLESLSRLNKLTQLTLNLRYSSEVNFEGLSKLSNLTQLALYPSVTEKSNLEGLSKLGSLTQLTLDLIDGRESDLEPLLNLNKLTQLTLGLTDGRKSHLESLSKLNKLTQLTLSLSYGSMSNLEPLSRLNRLTQLTLYLGYGSVSNLESLSELSNLTQLTLGLGSQVSNLEPLSKLSNLTQLTLDLRSSQVSNLEALSKLPRLQSLSIESATRAQRMSMRSLPASLVELKF